MATRRISWRSFRSGSVALLGFLAPVALLDSAQAQEPPGSLCEVNADCGSFEGCLDGMCMPLTPTDSPCAEDADCPDAGSVCVDSMCWAPEDHGGTGIDPDPDTTCESDADCFEGTSCIDGYCAGFVPPDGGGGCADDSECGEGSICVACFCMPSEGTCRADADCPSGQRCDVVSVGSAGGSPDGGDPGPVCEGSYGYCGIDYTQVESDPRCAAFCELMTSCDSEDDSVESGGESSGSSGDGTDSAEQALNGDAEECIGFCSYLLADADASDEMTSLVDCVTENAADGCDAVGAACGTEAQAVGEAAGDVPAGTLGDEDSASGGGEQTGAPRGESGSVGDLFGNAFGGGDDQGEEGADAGANGSANGTGDSTDDGSGASSSSCAVSRIPNPSILGLFLLTLGGLRLARRRR